MLGLQRDRVLVGTSQMVDRVRHACDSVLRADVNESLELLKWPTPERRALRRLKADYANEARRLETLVRDPRFGDLHLSVRLNPKLARLPKIAPNVSEPLSPSPATAVLTPGKIEAGHLGAMNRDLVGFAPSQLQVEAPAIEVAPPARRIRTEIQGPSRFALSVTRTDRYLRDSDEYPALYAEPGWSYTDSPSSVAFSIRFALSEALFDDAFVHYDREDLARQLSIWMNEYRDTVNPRSMASAKLMDGVEYDREGLQPFEPVHVKTASIQILGTEKRDDYALANLFVLEKLIRFRGRLPH